MEIVVPIAGAAVAGLGFGGYLYAGNWPTSQIFGSTVTAPAAGAVALTYDDGPSPRNTEALLDVLAEFHVHATFFLMGEHVRRHPHLARRIAEAGHTLGNHTVTHPKLLWCSSARARRELEDCQQIILDATGVTPRLFRPPFGSRSAMSLRIARAMGLTPVLWNVTAKDWEPLGVEGILHNIDTKMEKNSRAGKGSCILLHDASHLDTSQGGVNGMQSRADTVAVTRALLRRNLQFVTM